MLYLIAEQLGFPGVLNLVRYISFRAGAGGPPPPAHAPVFLGRGVAGAARRRWVGFSS